MARKRGCLGCIVKFLITMVVIVAILAGAVFFGGNYLLKRYVGDEGEAMALGINNWGDVYAISKVFNGKAPEMAEADKPSDANKQRAAAELQEKFNTSLITDGVINEQALADLLNNSEMPVLAFALTGGELASVVGIVNDYGGDVEIPLDEIPFSFERFSINAVSDKEAAITITVAIDVDKILDLFSGSSEDIAKYAGWLFKGDKIYLTFVNTLIATDGQAAAKEDGFKFLANNMKDSDGEKLLKVFSNLAGAESAQFGTTVANAVCSILNAIGDISFIDNTSSPDKIVITPNIPMP